jgi:UDP-GlcNAc:undecaprenyl-phosphate GlcNAc-1-phosphate transferase
MMVLVFALSAAVTNISMPFIKDMLAASGAGRENYLGEIIPTGLGIGFLPGLLCGNLFLLLLKGGDNPWVLLNVLAFTVMSCIGIVDDLLGSGRVRGLKGHLNCLLHGRLTTGGLKAVIGGITAALIAVVVSNSFIEGAVNCLMAMLFTNSINLLDLRPGRAAKSFYIMWGCSLFLMPVMEHTYILLPAAGCLTAYLPYDTRRRGMMGDAGSNALGISLGVYYCIGASMYQKIIITSVLIMLHIAAEKISLTGVIDRSRVLKFIDGIGIKRSDRV